MADMVRPRREVTEIVLYAGVMSTNQDGPMDEAASTPATTTPWGLALGRGAVDPASPPTEAIPVPLDGDDGEIIPPVRPPAASEVFPASSASRLPTYLDVPKEAAPEAPTTTSGFQILGSIAATNASLSASGAPTPLAGIPVGPVESDVPELDSGEAFTPQFRWQQATDGDDAPEESEEPDMPEPTVSSPNSLESIAAPATPAEHYEPRVAASVNPTPADTDSAPPAVPPASSSSVPWWRSPLALTLYGLVVMGGIGYGVYLMFFEPEDIVLPPSSVVTAPLSTAPEPLTELPANDLIAQLPSTTLTHAITSAQATAPRDVPGLEVRVAEVWDVVYSDGTDDITLRILRHYTEEEAIRAWNGFAADADPREPVTASDTVVGERARLDTDAGTLVMWRNLTLILMASGEGDVEDFVRLFPY